MVLHQDYRELLSLLNENKVDYLVVGAYALGFLGVPRNTGDIDIWIRSEEENAKKIVNALNDFGLASLGYKAADFLDSNLIIQLGVPPVRIDIMMSISGVEFDEAFPNRNVMESEGIKINYINKEYFIKNKKASGRLKDLADIESLSLIQG
ncbi:hypothetical protein C0389_05725 [bacterium]|nr:hypothetical protein [bacterium]